MKIFKKDKPNANASDGLKNASFFQILARCASWCVQHDDDDVNFVVVRADISTESY